MGFIAPAAPPVDIEEWKRLPLPRADQAAGAGLGGQRRRHARRGLPAVHRQAGRSSSSARPADHLGDDAGARGPGQPRQTGGPSRSSSRSSPCGRCCGRSSGSARVDAADLPLHARRSAASSTGCARARSACRRGPSRVPLTRGSRRTLLDVGALRGRARRRRLPAGLRTARPWPAPPAGGSTRARSPCCSASSALLGLRDKVVLPGGAPGAVRVPADRVPVPARQPDRRLADRLLLHLVGRGRVEAQPALPVRRGGDDQQHAVEPLARRQAPGSGATIPTDMRPVASAASVAAHLGTAMEFALPLVLLLSRGGTLCTIARDRDDHLPRPHHLDVPAGGAARVEPVHDLRAAVPVRALRRRAVLDARRSAADRVIVLGRRAHPGRSATCARTRSRSSPSMRYYAGNWATSQWLFRKDSGAEAKLDRDDRQAGADRRRAADQALRSRDGRAAADQGPGLPLDAPARPGAERAACPMRSTTSRPTTCARAS